MNPAELPLRDIHLPTPVSWWPPAPGWWLLVIAMFVVVGLLWRWWQRRRAWRRSALFAARAELARVATGWREHGDPQRLARELSTLLRRVGISIRAREQAASLTGAAWWRYLDELAGHPVFGVDGGQLISEAPYRPAADVDGARLLTLCERWLTAVSERERSPS